MCGYYLHFVCGFSLIDPDNAFQINHADKSFHVFAQTRADKTNWIANLTKQINKLNKGIRNE